MLVIVERMFMDDCDGAAVVDGYDVVAMLDENPDDVES